MSIFSSGYGFWGPLAWLLAFIISLVVVLIIRSLGRPDHESTPNRDLPFLSGDKEDDLNVLHIRSENLYWGFLETLKGYYNKLMHMHSGVATDYVIWFLGVLAVIIVIGLIK